MIFQVLIDLLVGVIKFIINLLPTINLSLDSVSNWILNGFNTLMTGKGIVCLFLPMDTVRVLLGIVLTWSIFEVGYWGVLYVRKLF
ncbi:hypothetical protein [Anaerorhabdus sp.]|uniref:hypothetical protein n=1 Tax=Anaerorhabdus sp. TaxID=1872524 RepID=UPI002FCBB2A0